MRKSPFLPLLIFLAASCGGGDSAASGSSATVTDSAGVRIVMNTSPVLSPGDGWRVDPEPVVKLGDEANEPPEETFGRIAGLFVLSNNEVLVVDRESAQLRYFGLDGRFLRAKGRRGNGPGEHEWIARAWRIHGDTLILSPGDSRRLSLLTGAGEFVETLHLAEVDGTAIRAIFRDGGLVSFPRRSQRFVPPDTDGEVTRIMYDQDVIAGRSGAVEVDLGHKPGPVDSPRLRRQRFSPVRAHAAGEYYFTARTSEYSIESFDRSGRLVMIVRRGVVPQPVSERESEEFFSTRLASVLREGGIREVQERYLGEANAAPFHPVFSGLMVDRSEHIWVRDYRVREDGILFGYPFESEAGAPQVWQIFSPDGIWLTSVEVPHRLWITDIGESHIAGIWRDENFTESARVYSLHRR